MKGEEAYVSNICTEHLETKSYNQSTILTIIYPFLAVILFLVVYYGPTISPVIFVILPSVLGIILSASCHILLPKS